MNANNDYYIFITTYTKQTDTTPVSLYVAKSTPVPEPASIAAISLGLLGFIRKRRRV